MSADHVEKLAASMDAGVRSYLARNPHVDGVHLFTPADAAIASEEIRARLAEPAEEQEESPDEWVVKEREAGALSMLRFLFSSGAHPLRVMRRTIAAAVAMEMEPYASMTYDEVGMLTGTGKACVSYQMKILANVVKLRAGARFSKLPGQKDPRCKASYSAAQKGNENRKNGKRNGTGHNLKHQKTI